MSENTLLLGKMLTSQIIIQFTANVLALFIFVTGEERDILGFGNACGSFQCSNIFIR